MIHEEICTYEVCKLAKEKGFNEYEACNNIYESDEQWHTLTPYTNAKGIDWSKDKFAVAPSQSLLQRWLREEKRVCISVEAYPTYATKNNILYSWAIKYRSSGHSMECQQSFNTFSTYEKALEEALKYALENLV